MNEKIDKIFSVNIDEIKDIKFKTDEKFCLIVNYEGYKYEFLINIVDFTKDIIVFNPNSKIQESFLNELNLYEDTFLFDNVSKNVIYYLDPTKEHYTGLNYGFGIGTWKTWHLNNIAKIIEVISKNISQHDESKQDNNNLFFYGRDQYGFMAMALSTLIKNSSSILENPQFNLEFGSNWGNLKDTYLKNLTEEQFKEISYRMNILDLINKERYIPNSYILMKTSDSNYFNSQGTYFLENFSNLPNVFNKSNSKFNMNFDTNNSKIYNKYDSLNFINESVNVQTKRNNENTSPILMLDEFKNKLDLNYNRYINEDISREDFIDFNNSYFKEWINCRVDLKNMGNETNRIEILEKDDVCSVVFPRWFKNKEGEGCNIFSSEKIKLKIKCINDGKLRFNLLGADYRFLDNRRIPIYICYTKFKINDEIIFSKDILVSHDNLYEYNMNCKNDEILDIEIEFNTLNNYYPYIQELITFMNDYEDIEKAYDMFNDYERYIQMINNLD